MAEDYSADGVSVKKLSLDTDNDGQLLLFKVTTNFRRLASGTDSNMDMLATIDKLVVTAEEAGAATAEGEAAGYQGELGLFELKGQVKKCEWEYPWDKIVRTFDENGFWLTNNGQKLAEIYTSGIKRDKANRIVQGLSQATAPDSEGGQTTTYQITKTDDHGNWTERKVKQPDGDYTEKRKIEYY